MNIPRRVFTVAAVAATLAVVCGMAAAQSYPTRPVTLVVPFAAGGPTDIVARTLAAVMPKTLGQTVLREHKTRAAGTLAAG